jgi:multiple sugar transport system permease protein
VRPAYSIRYRPRVVMRQILIVGLTVIGTAVIMLPIVWMVNVAVRPIKEILTYPPKLIPDEITFEYIAGLLQNQQYRGYFLNSCILTLSALVLTIVLGLLAAYGFSRFKMRGGRLMLLGIMAMLMLPQVTLIIPYFRLAYALHLFDSLIALILVDSAFILPICIWLLKGYIDAIPVELEEAALIDGASRLQAIWKVVVPLTIPGIVGAATFAFIDAWNEYLFAVVLTDTPASKPLTIGLAAFFGQYVRDWNSIMALSTISSLPLVLLFIFFQRWVVQGMTSGAVK